MQAISLQGETRKAMLAQAQAMFEAALRIGPNNAFASRALKAVLRMKNN